MLTLIVVPSLYMGTGQPSGALRVQLPTREHCEAVRAFVNDLDRLVPDTNNLHVGECAKILKETLHERGSE